jgi:hypothetical protein
VIKNKNSPNNEKMFQKLIREYVKNLSALIQDKKFKNINEEKKYYMHLNKIIDCLSVEEVFLF